MSDEAEEGYLVSCAGCGAALTRDEANEIGVALAMNDTFRKDVLEGTVPAAFANPMRVAVTFHGLHECLRCGPYQRLRITLLDGPPRAAA